jgi:hypothetical protein
LGRAANFVVQAESDEEVTWIMTSMQVKRKQERNERLFALPITLTAI